METKQMLCLEVKKGDFTFSFHIPVGATWGTAIDVAYDFLEQVSKMSQEQIANSRPQEPKEE